MANPYAYQEESPELGQSFAWENETETDQEPLTPMDILLTRGFGGRVTRLTIYHDCCELAVVDGSDDDTITISRNEAAQCIKVKASKLTIRRENSRMSFRFKRDKELELKRARLETWCRQSWDNDPIGAYKAVLSLLKRNVCAPVIGLMFFMATLQLGYFAIQLVDYLLGNWDKEYELVFVIFLLVFHASPALISLSFALLLWLRQIWALMLGAVLSIIPLVSCSLVLVVPDARTRIILFFVTLICLLVTYSFLNATFRYFRQRSLLIGSVTKHF